MLTKNSIKNMKKVYVWIAGKDMKFSDGKKSKAIVVYDSHPDAVFRVVEKALSEQ